MTNRIESRFESQLLCAISKLHTSQHCNICALRQWKISDASAPDRKHSHKLHPFNYLGIFEEKLTCFFRPAYSWGIAGSAVRVEASKHLDSLR